MPGADGARHEEFLRRDPDCVYRAGRRRRLRHGRHDFGRPHRVGARAVRRGADRAVHRGLAYVSGVAWSPRRHLAHRATLVAVGIGGRAVYRSALHAACSTGREGKQREPCRAEQFFECHRRPDCGRAVLFRHSSVFRRFFGMNLSAKDAGQSSEKLHDSCSNSNRRYKSRGCYFLSASLITLADLYLLCRQRPDFLLRTVSWFSFHAAGICTRSAWPTCRAKGT